MSIDRAIERLELLISLYGDARERGEMESSVSLRTDIDRYLRNITHPMDVMDRLHAWRNGLTGLAQRRYDTPEEAVAAVNARVQGMKDRYEAVVLASRNLRFVQAQYLALKEDPMASPEDRENAGRVVAFAANTLDAALDKLDAEEIDAGLTE